MAKATPEGAIPAGDIPPVKPDTEQKSEVKSYAGGKYKTVDDLEKGYGEQAATMGKQGTELGKVRAENKALKESQAATEKAATNREEKARNEVPPTDYEQMLRDVSKQYEDGEISFEDAMLKTNSITAQRGEVNTSQKLAEMQETLTNSFKNTLQERDQDAVAQKFHEKNPEYLVAKESGKLDALKEADPLHDDFSAFWKLKADEALEKGKEEAARIQGGSTEAGKVIAEPGSELNQPKPKPQTDLEMKASMLKAAEG